MSPPYTNLMDLSLRRDTRTTCKLNFSNWIVVAGGGFLSYCDHQLIKLEDDKRFGL